MEASSQLAVRSLNLQLSIQIYERDESEEWRRE